MTTGKLQADDTLKALLIAIQKLGEGTHAGEKERKNGAKTEMEEDGMDSKIYSKANIILGEKKVCKKTKKTFIGNKRHRNQRSLDREISSYRKTSPRSDKGQASSSDSSDDEMEKLKEALDRHVKVRQGIGVGWERTPFVFTQGGKDTISTIDEGNEEEYDSDDESNFRFLLQSVEDTSLSTSSAVLQNEIMSNIVTSLRYVIQKPDDVSEPFYM
ncbi:hypothetical protein ACJMK2_016853 [Sinanodonta woodiana]|uniref:Uncharacterized protein n=1 Tax=Sinanodonta woodiana TaxID=1069815 RepID=A0ABD3UY60_SINWO